MHDEVNVNADIVTALRLIKNFKQGAILENSLLTAQFQQAKDVEMNLSDEAVKQITESEMAMQLAKKIIEQKSSHITRADRTVEFGIPVTETRLELLVLATPELKEIVEYCIRVMPEEAVTKIRNSKQ